jgi:flavoprotein
MTYADVNAILSREGRLPNEQEREVIHQHLKTQHEICRVCGMASSARAKNFMCSACHGPAYCSKACQKEDWAARHKIECKDKKRRDDKRQVDALADVGGEICGTLTSPLARLSQH